MLRDFFRWLPAVALLYSGLEAQAAKRFTKQSPNWCGEICKGFWHKQAGERGFALKPTHRDAERLRTTGRAQLPPSRRALSREGSNARATLPRLTRQRLEVLWQRCARCQCALRLPASFLPSGPRREVCCGSMGRRADQKLLRAAGLQLKSSREVLGRRLLPHGC